MQLLSAAKNANEASSLPGILTNGVEALRADQAAQKIGSDKAITDLR